MFIRLLPLNLQISVDLSISISVDPFPTGLCMPGPIVSPLRSIASSAWWPSQAVMGGLEGALKHGSGDDDGLGTKSMNLWLIATEFGFSFWNFNCYRKLYFQACRAWPRGLARSKALQRPGLWADYGLQCWWLAHSKGIAATVLGIIGTLEWHLWFLVNMIEFNYELQSVSTLQVLI